ncbi:diguanylate cyclase [Vibrio sp. SCSIO 43136]|uniref:sensor domain-containing diguanylate cyclase n=1 Tax=Vibrio sp. SCSIO 43136 TaxID=2819101 RepID=UPI0020754EE4|nr:diguanylate cyclase [Vibrio sp. SCSIO 43136]USD67997.1 diguanylate cyclase [Vibrio sp. SCSIO 43136]
MKLRSLFVITFCFISIIPTTLFWAWPYSQALESEINDVNERHLVIAKNLSTAFERYYLDVVGIFSITSLISVEKAHHPEFQKLLESYHFNAVTRVDSNGQILECLFPANQECAASLPTHIMALAQATLSDDDIVMSPVTEDKIRNSGPILLVIKKTELGLIIGYLSTQYISETGKKVAFGEKGHAAVVDQQGNVLAHPLDSWVAERRNISAVSAVQKMLAGQTGVERFYSPALKGDMIAGYTHVSHANWGVMVPQPISELENKAKDIDKMATLVMMLGIALALALTIPISRLLIRPLETLLENIKKFEKSERSEDISFHTQTITPVEVKEINKSFASMIENIERNKQQVSQLAYLDSLTGLANRQYFRQLTKAAFVEMKQKQQSGALIFIDLDGFKQVNDKYGHKLGDELLKTFGLRLLSQLQIPQDPGSALEYYQSLPSIIPARMGGDEFVLLFQNLHSDTNIEERLKALFEPVFGDYRLENGVSTKIGGSMGVALYPQHGEDYDKLLKLADMAMYRAKGSPVHQVKIAQKV